jgi:hypothetical protein
MKTESPKIERFDRFQGRRKRNRRIGAIAVAAAIASLVAIVGIGAIDRSTPSPDGQVGASRARAILDGVVPAPDQPPGGMEIYRQLNGGEALSWPFDGPAPGWAGRGLVDARANDFVTSEGPHGAVNTWAAVYESTGAAHTAFLRWTQHLEEAFSDPGASLDLGDEGVRYAADAAVRWENCEPAAGFVWRSGPVILQILACEGPGLALADDVAAQMAADAEVAGGGEVTAARADRLLDALLVEDGDLPGMEPMPGSTGRQALGAPFDRGVAEAWALEGFVDARLNAFGDPDRRGLLGSWAAVYESEAAAAAVFPRFVEVFTADPPYGFGFAGSEELAWLGDGGWRFGGAGGERIGVSRECRSAGAYLWRSGPVILHVLGCREAHIARLQEAVTSIRFRMDRTPGV